MRTFMRVVSVAAAVAVCPIAGTAQSVVFDYNTPIVRVGGITESTPVSRELAGLIFDFDQGGGVWAQQSPNRWGIGNDASGNMYLTLGAEKRVNENAISLMNFHEPGVPPVTRMTIRGGGQFGFDCTWVLGACTTALVAGEEGTAGSGAGTTFRLSDGISWTATYSEPIAIGGDDAVGDLFSTLTIEFARPMERLEGYWFHFDVVVLDPTVSVPEPSMALLLAAAVAARIAVRRRERSRRAP